MVFQFQRLKYHIVITLIALVLVSVMPVSAVFINGYYNVAPNIQQGATVFIGEQGLNISDALASANAQGSPTAITTIGWWASAANIHLSSPTVTIDLNGRQDQFTVTQAEFDGYEGQWYLVDSVLTGVAKANAGAVFNVKSPKLDITIRDVGQNDGADVSGTSVPNGTKLQFQIGTNMYMVLNPAMRNPVYNLTGSGVNTDGYLDIQVKYQNGTTFSKLFDDNNLERTLIALNVTTQPYTWGRANAGRGPGIDYVWNTSTYPPGTYTVSVLSRLNNMQSNYLIGGTMYTGRTVSNVKTITIIGMPLTTVTTIPITTPTPIPIMSATTKIGTYNPDLSIWYLDYNGNGLWEPGTDKAYFWGATGYQPVTGNWDGSVDGKVKIGTYNPTIGIWYLDYNGNGLWEPGTDKVYNWGAPGYQPVTGDWNGDGKVKIGTYNPSLSIWYLDYNGNGLWEPGTDKVYRWGATGYAPVVGKWS